MTARIGPAHLAEQNAANFSLKDPEAPNVSAMELKAVNSGLKGQKAAGFSLGYLAAAVPGATYLRQLKFDGWVRPCPRACKACGACRACRTANENVAKSCGMKSAAGKTAN